MALEHEMERIGRILAADAGIQVAVRGAKAYALPGKIVIPALENYSCLGGAAERMLHGLLDHEVGHALDTDFGVLRKGEERSSFVRSILNALEDGLIEARQGKRYIGAAQNLQLKNEWFWAEQLGDLKPARVRVCEEPFLTAFALALTLVVRPFGGQRIETIYALRPHLGKLLMACRPEIEALERLRDQSKATAHVLVLARQIAKKAKEWPPEPGARSKKPKKKPERSKEPAASKPSSDPDGEPEAGEDPADEPEAEDDDGDGDGDEPEAEDDGDEPEAEDDDSDTEREERDVEEEGSLRGSGDDGDEPEDDDGDGSASGDGDDSDGDEPEVDGESEDDEASTSSTWDETKVTNPEDALKKEIESKIEILYGDGSKGYFVESHEWDVEVDLSQPELTKSEVDYFDTLCLLTSYATDVLARTFEASLRAMREKWPVHGADHGEIDPALLGEFAVGSANADTIYQQMLAVDDRDVVVGVLVDCSGSMNGKPAEMATQAAIAMTRALSAVGIAHEVTGFTTNDFHFNRNVNRELLPWLRDQQALCAQRRESLGRALEEMKAAGDDPYRYARTFWHGFARLPVHAVFKSFGSSEMRGLLRIGGYQQNLDGEAVLWEARRLASRPEARRILLVLSDGQPCGGRSNDATAEHLRDSLKRVIEAGIEVYAIGILSMHVRDLFPPGNWWVVNDLNDLAQVAVGALTEALTTGRTERKWTRID